MNISKKMNKLLETFDVPIYEDETPKYPLNRQAIKYLKTVDGKEYKLAIVFYEGSRGGVLYAYLSSDKKSYCRISTDDNDFGIMNISNFTGRFINWV